MEISSRDFSKWTVQQVADFLLDHDNNGAVCQGVVNGKLYNLVVKLEVEE